MGAYKACLVGRYAPYMEADQLLVVLHLVIVFYVKAPTRRKPDGHSMFLSTSSLTGRSGECKRQKMRELERHLNDQNEPSACEPGTKEQLNP